MFDRSTLPPPQRGAIRHTFDVACSRCQKTTRMTVQSADFLQWQKGMNVQMAFPYINAKWQELLVNDICVDCADIEANSACEEMAR